MCLVPLNMSDFQSDSLFSLEGDDASQLFITKIPRNEKMEEINQEESGENSTQIMQFGIKENDFESLCISLISKLPHYLDISDDELDFSNGQER